jgi:hypothetical protein
VSGFEFDLLPLSASVADPELVQGENAGEKNIGLFNGDTRFFVFYQDANTSCSFQVLH